MTGRLLAEFADAARFAETARRTRRLRYRLVESYTPFPIADVWELIEPRNSRIRPIMLIGGLSAAAAAYGLEYYSAVINYPYDSGGRPLDAWPAFMLVPFAIGILVAAVCGFIVFLRETALPRLSDPVFMIDGFERASQDRFMLVLELPGEQDDRQQAVKVLKAAGAISVREIA